MKLIIDNITLLPDEPQNRIRDIIKERFDIDFEFEYSIARKSLDARKKRNIVYRYRVIIEIPDVRLEMFLKDKDVSIYKEKVLSSIKNRVNNETVIIVGSGPAGLFCALRLIEAGARVEIVERGRPVDERMTDIELLESRGILNEQSNVLFGEGGAGTYSDGKLTTRIRRPEIDWVFRKIVEYGAPSSVLYEAKPHLGTDRLRGIVKNIRKDILGSGSMIFFNESVDDIVIHQGAIAGIITSQGREIETSRLVMAIGHSARDTFILLQKRGAVLEKKGFAVGVRIEHPSALIDEIQYGVSPYRGILPAAEYVLSCDNSSSGRGVYSFCMCPGGKVINSSSERGRLCTNGMSFSKRNLSFSNAALVVTVSPSDCPDGVMGGVAFQRMIEEAAYAAGSGSFSAPAQRVTSFLHGRIDTGLPPVSYRPATSPADVGSYLPDWLTAELKAGLRCFERKMKGFITDEAVLIGAETRTSSPVRICRGADCQSISIRGLYPIGEGAGYAGGIISSAVDGIRCADNIITELSD